MNDEQCYKTKLTIFVLTSFERKTQKRVVQAKNPQSALKRNCVFAPANVSCLHLRAVKLIKYL